MTDNLRDRIAQAIYDSSDEYTRKLMVRPDCPGASDVEGEWKPVCYRWADAVIAALGLEPHLAKRIINGKPDQWVRRCVTDWEIVDD